MGKHKNTEQWKKELVGKKFGYLVVEDVYNRKALCLCDCGNRKEVSIYHLLDGHSISCGCYKTSETKAKKYSEWCRNNPETLKEKGVRHSQWFRDNPEKKEEWRKHIIDSCTTKEFRENISEKRKKYFRNHPESRVEYSERSKEYFKQHPDKLKDLHNSIRKWIKNNPDKVKERSKKYSIWCHNNPDKIKRKSEKHREWNRENKDRLKEIAENHKVFYSKYRKKNITNSGKQILKSILKEKDYILFCDGLLTSGDKVIIHCPDCGKEVECLFGNIFVLDRNELKRELPRCNTCRTSSRIEKEVEEYISSFYKEKCVRNSRDIVPPYELDLYYPEKRIGIEINGTFWHSSIFKHKQFHFLKWKYCLDHNIRLVSIFEYDLLNNKEKIYSFLKDQFSTSYKISARDCVIKKIESDQIQEFLDLYDIESRIKPSDINYGLFYNNSLVSCMFFNRLSEESSFELTSFVTKFGYKVYGGVTKLFGAFVKEYNPTSIVSHSNNDYFSGSLYPILGFSFSQYNIRGIDWQLVKYKSVMNKEDLLNTRLCPKYECSNTLDIFEQNKKYMLDQGYLLVYRCGNSEWVWRKDPS